MPFLMIRDDIVNVKADAVVNPANEKLLEGSGTSRAIYLAAGEQKLEKACRRIGHCDTGKAVITKGFDLPAKYIIHAVGPLWMGGDCGEEQLLYSAYRESLMLARRRRLKSIAFPLLSAGNYHYPKEQAMKTALRAISDFLLEYEMLVYLVLYDRNSVSISKNLSASIDEYIDDHYVETKDEHLEGDAGYPDFTRGQTPEWENWRGRPMPEAGLQRRSFRGEDLSADRMVGSRGPEYLSGEMFSQADLTSPDYLRSQPDDGEEMPDYLRSQPDNGEEIPDYLRSRSDDGEEIPDYLRSQPDDGEEIPDYPPEAADRGSKFPGRLPAASADELGARARESGINAYPPTASSKLSAPPGVSKAPGIPVSGSRKRSLEQLLAHMDETFSQMLLRLIDERGLKDSSVYRKANVDRRHFSKIRNDVNYAPNKKTVLAFAIALELSLDETKDLLMRAGFAFSSSSRFDVIVCFFIENRQYDIFEINEALFAYGQPLLGQA